MAVIGVPLSKAVARAAFTPSCAAGVRAESRRAAAAEALCGPGVAVVRAFFDAAEGLLLPACSRKPSFWRGFTAICDKLALADNHFAVGEQRLKQSCCRMCSHRWW